MCQNSAAAYGCPYEHTSTQDSDAKRPQDHATPVLSSSSELNSEFCYELFPGLSQPQARGNWLQLTSLPPNLLLMAEFIARLAAKREFH